MSFLIKGTESLKQSLKQISDVRKYKEVVKVNTTKMHQKANRRVPVDTSHLKRSITLDFKEGGLIGRVYTDVEYAIYVDKGTRFQTAQPFMTSSFFEQRQEFVNDMAKAILK